MSEREGYARFNKIFKRHKIEPEKILCIYHDKRMNMICLDTGNEIDCTATMQELLAFLPEEDFLSISRSTIVRRDKIINISYEGVYTMIDGHNSQNATALAAATLSESTPSRIGIRMV